MRQAGRARRAKGRGATSPPLLAPAGGWQQGPRQPPLAAACAPCPLCPCRLTGMYAWWSAKCLSTAQLDRALRGRQHCHRLQRGNGEGALLGMMGPLVVLTGESRSVGGLQHAFWAGPPMPHAEAAPPPPPASTAAVVATRLWRNPVAAGRLDGGMWAAGRVADRRRRALAGISCIWRADVRASLTLTIAIGYIIHIRWLRLQARHVTAGRDCGETQNKIPRDGFNSRQIKRRNVPGRNMPWKIGAKTCVQVF